MSFRTLSSVLRKPGFMSRGIILAMVVLNFGFGASLVRVALADDDVVQSARSQRERWSGDAQRRAVETGVNPR